jgi:hypothetical protein
VPRWRATAAAKGASSYAASVKPIVNVRTGTTLCACINAVTSDESTPPERNTPSGTSETMRRRTASRSSLSNSCDASSSDPRKRCSMPRITASRTDQYVVVSIARVAGSNVSIVPGMSLKTPS